MVKSNYRKREGPVKSNYRKREDPTTGTGVSVSMRREAKRYTSGRNTGQNEKVKGKDQVQGHGALSPASESGGVSPTPATQSRQPDLAALGAGSSRAWVWPDPTGMPSPARSHSEHP